MTKKQFIKLREYWGVVELERNSLLGEAEGLRAKVKEQAKLLVQREVKLLEQQYLTEAACRSTNYWKELALHLSDQRVREMLK